MSWIKQRKAPESLEILGRLSNHCATMGGPLSATLNALVQAGDYKSLVEYDIDYRNVELRDAICSRQILGFFQKLEFLDLGFDKAAVAADRFVLAEAMCRKTNRAFRNMSCAPETVGARVHSVLHTASRKIRDILGAVPSFDDLSFVFGPGANTNVKSAVACPRAKLSARLECSAGLAPTVGEALSEFPHWMALHAYEENESSYFVEVSVVPGKVDFVPKNAKTFRAIQKEPLVNSILQKGFGTYLRDRLSRFGVDLHDQTRNQKLAMQGSIDGRLATVDLSMASDCVSRELVWELLPFDWSELLDRLRTPDVELPSEVSADIIAHHEMEDTMGVGKLYRYEKFSSMGNGFTFELESLIFYGICLAVVESLKLDTEDVSVYGDDLIVPSEAYDLLEVVLKFCGFSLNTEKSFSTGPFRESCGADFLNGFDIRPFYQKTLVSDRTLFLMHNWMIRHGEFELAEVIKRECNPCYLLFGPDGFGDGHLIGSFELRRNRQQKRDGWGGGYFDTYSLKPKSFTGLMPGDAVLPVYSVYTRSGKDSPTDPNVVRGTNGYAKVSIYTFVSSIFSRRQ